MIRTTNSGNSEVWYFSIIIIHSIKKVFHNLDQMPKWKKQRRWMTQYLQEAKEMVCEILHLYIPVHVYTQYACVRISVN